MPEVVDEKYMRVSIRFCFLQGHLKDNFENVLITVFCNYLY